VTISLAMWEELAGKVGHHDHLITNHAYVITPYTKMSLLWIRNSLLPFLWIRCYCCVKFVC